MPMESQHIVANLQRIYLGSKQYIPVLYSEPANARKCGREQTGFGLGSDMVHMDLKI